MNEALKNFHATMGEVSCFEDALDIVNGLHDRIAQLDEDGEAIKVIQGYLIDLDSELNFFIDQRNEQNTSEYDEYVAQHRQTVRDVL